MSLFSKKTLPSTDPAGTADARINAIASEGARVDVVDGTYEDTVVASAALATDDHLVVSDTSWPGYAEVPRWGAEASPSIGTAGDVDDFVAAVRRIAGLGVTSLVFQPTQDEPDLDGFVAFLDQVRSALLA